MVYSVALVDTFRPAHNTLRRGQCTSRGRHVADNTIDGHILRFWALVSKVTKFVTIKTHDIISRFGTSDIFSRFGALIGYVTCLVTAETTKILLNSKFLFPALTILTWCLG